MSETFWIRTRRGVEGPVSRERVLLLVARNQVGSLDEISSDGRTWTRIRRTEFWGGTRRTPPVQPPLATRAVNPKPLEQEPESAPQQPTPSPKPQLESKSSTVSRIELPADSEKRVWKLPTMEEEEREARNPNTETKQESPPNTGFSIWHVLFKGVFKHHDETSVSAILNGKRRGGQDGKPPETWLWSRIFLVSSVLAAIMWYMAYDGNILALPGFFFTAAFGIPLAVLVFFLECNIGGRVSGWKAMGVFMIGGVLSILFTQLFNNTEMAENLYGSMEAAGAGPIEEPAKALILLWFAGRSKRYPFILDGLLLGAAVGAGFAAFETAGYIFGTLMADGFEAMTAIALLRGALAPFMHIAWTAAVGAAMWTARGRTGSLADAVFAWRTLGALALSIGLHALWNAGMAGTWLSQIAWVPIVHYLRRGIAQCSEPATK